ncbi:MAG TPA: indole-3-glycerol-phosphate synthase [Candidatus Cryosericum sp.]|nr:indole-3-glycerol-phosphate synthase [Candidatus Cryosericum sp.]
MADLLSRMASLSAGRVAEARGREGEAALLRRAHATPAAPPLVLHPDGFDLFAEIKRRAPSAGRLGAAREEDAEAAVRRARGYSEAGAAAVSVLTEPDAFGGGLDDLEATARAASVPVLRKDFIVDPYQVAEARAAGAGGVLLIVRLLEGTRLSETIGAAAGLGLFVLLEAFDESDLERAGEVAGPAGRAGARLLAGVNARDLATLEVDVSRLRRLSGRCPAGLTRVAESGLATPDDARRAAAWGYDAALVGRALMTTPEPEALARRMIAAGRRAARSRCASA